MQTVIDFLFLLMGKHLKGYRTLILAIAAVIIGAWEWLTGSGLFDFLCSISEAFQALTVFCNVTETKFYGIILVIIGALQYLLRKLTDTPAGESGTSSFSVKQANPVLLALGVIFFLLLVFILFPMALAWLS